MADTKTYSEMAKLKTFMERFEYLSLHGQVGESTFGFDRHVNQKFYKSQEWKNVRNAVIVRDNGCDLGVDGCQIQGSLLIHHINPMIMNDIVDAEAWIINPEFLITTTQTTHNAIHYGDAGILPKPYEERVPGDTQLWPSQRSI